MTVMEVTHQIRLTLAMLRNIYRPEENSEAWQEVVESFPNGVPRFSSKAECEEWMRK
jgi:hypothetical protein